MKLHVKIWGHFTGCFQRNFSCLLIFTVASCCCWNLVHDVCSHAFSDMLIIVQQRCRVVRYWMFLTLLIPLCSSQHTPEPSSNSSEVKFHLRQCNPRHLSLCLSFKESTSVLLESCIFVQTGLSRSEEGQGQIMHVYDWGNQVRCIEHKVFRCHLIRENFSVLMTLS